MNKKILTTLFALGSIIAAPFIINSNDKEENTTSVKIIDDGHNHDESVEQIVNYDFQLETGSQHVISRTEDGDVFTWGNNASGQLGTGKNSQIITKEDLTNYDENVEIGEHLSNASFDPVKVNLNGEKVIKVESGIAHNIALTESGNVYRWGSWALDGGNNYTQFTPELIDSGATDVFAGYNSSAYVKSGKMYVFGNNAFGQLGKGDKISTMMPAELAVIVDPETDMHIREIEFGSNHSLFKTVEIHNSIEEPGYLYASGNNISGQLGLDKDQFPETTIPTKVFGFSTSPKHVTEGLPTIGNIAAGENVSFITLNTGVVLSTGENDNGKLGDGSLNNRDNFGIVHGLETEQVVEVKTAKDTVLATTLHGEVFTWGASASNANMIEDSNVYLVPKYVSSLTGETIIFTDIAEGDDRTSFAVTARGDVYGFGSNGYGQLRDNSFGTYIKNESMFKEEMYKFENSLLYTKSAPNWTVIGIILGVGSVFILIPMWLIGKNYLKSKETKNFYSEKKTNNIT